MRKFNEKEKAVIFVGITLGTALLFFVLGIMFSTYQAVILLDHIQIQELNVDLNETQLVDYMYEKVGVNKIASNSHTTT